MQPMAGQTSEFNLNQYYSDTPAGRSLYAITICLLVITVVLSPLPFGSVQPQWKAFWIAIAAVTFGLWIARLVLAADPESLDRFQIEHAAERDAYQKLPFLLRHKWVAILVRIVTLGKWPRKYQAEHILIAPQIPRIRFVSFFGYPIRKTGFELPVVLFLAYGLFQIVPLPDPVLAWISPNAFNIHQSADRISEMPRMWHTLSVDPFSTLTKTLEYSAYFMLFIVVANSTFSRKTFLGIIIAVIFSACFQACYGAYEHLSGRQQIFTYRKKYNLESATGTFINRNHFASYLAMSLPLVLALLVKKRRFRMSETGFVINVIRFVERHGSQILLILLAVALIFSAILLSLSRSGIIFSVLSCGLFLLIIHRSRFKRSSSATVLAALAVLVLVVGGARFESILQRFQISWKEGTVGARLTLWKDTFDIFQDYRITGCGLGSFPEIYPSYRSSYDGQSYRQTHNDYLQLAAESGIPFLLFLAVGVKLILERLGALHKKLHWDQYTVIQIGVICSLTALALHSLTDFSSQIPAVALQGSVLAGLLFGFDLDETG